MRLEIIDGYLSCRKNLNNNPSLGRLFWIVWVHPKFIEILIPNVMILGGGTIGGN